MQRLVERLRRGLEEFVEQRDDLLLLLGCSDADAAITAKVVRDAEQANGTDLFLLFTDDFVLPDPYVSVLAERLREEHSLACRALEDEGKPPFPPIPPLLFDAREPPAARLYAGISWARSLLPAEGGHRLVWAMCPQRIADRRAWLELAAPFAPRGGVEPWMRGLRLLFRDAPGTAAFAPGLAAMPRVRVAEADFGPEALRQAMTEEVEDESLPDDARMQSLLMLASINAAHGRTDEAAGQYYTLLGHFQHTGNLSMQAFVLVGLGDMAAKAGDSGAAQHWYECAIVPASEAKDALMLATVSRHLGGLAHARGDLAAAEQYYAHLDTLAGHMLSPQLKVEALQQLGLVQEQAGALDRAVGSWEGAATLARAMGDLPDLHRVTLAHLQRAYSRLRMYDRLAAVGAELAGGPPAELAHAGGGAP
ncbi:MAG: hypothetical protein AB1941_00220 [Gemmatimonadota bacterium]